MEWITVVGVLATSASMAIAGLTLVLIKILNELHELNVLLRCQVVPGESVGYSGRDSLSEAEREGVIH